MIVDFKSLWDFIREFNPVEHKYYKYLPHVAKSEIEKEKLQQLNIPQSNNVHWTLDDIEETYQTVERVYGEQEDEFCRIIELTKEKFLGSYVDIEGIDQMFHASYFYFEWMMHLEYSRNKHDYTYYRDHYIHQVKNMYEMFLFLDKLKYEDICYDWYRKGNNRVAEMLQKSIRDELENSNEGEKIRNILKQVKNIEERKEEKITWEEEKCVEKALYGYIFYAATIIASLIHDIGYPIAYIGRTVKELGELIPFSHLFVQEVETISTIHSVLQDSLLYKVAGQKEVAERLGEKDHGALSATILLYKYYDNGKIAMLSPVKRAAIELGALMIYNHTLKYRNQGDKKSIYYKNIFEENPMSYLFRLCDDLQEWNRIYFEISRKSNFFICGDCYMPMTKGRIGKSHAQEGEKEYSCWCGQKRGINTTTFAYRRLICVDACSRLEIIGLQEGRMCHSIKIIYDKGRLLQIAAYNPSFAVKRGEGVWELKKMLERQSVFPNTFLDAFVSNNPIFLKSEILLEWLEQENREEFTAYVEKCLKVIKSLKKPTRALFKLLELFGRENSKLEELWKRLQSGLWSELKEQMENKKWEKEDGGKSSFGYIHIKTYFYFFLAFSGRLIQQMEKRVWIPSCKSDEINLKHQFRKIKAVICQRFKLLDRVEATLMGAILEQKTKQFDEKQFEEIKSQEEWEMYFSFCQHNWYDVDLVTAYVKEQTYTEIKEEAWVTVKEGKVVTPRYDYYSDYYFYYIIEKMVRNRRESKEA